MKTRLELAHEYALEMAKQGIPLRSCLELGWKYADAMQSEADKRKTKCDEKIEINMYPEYDATINYPPDAWVMYRGEKRLAFSIKEEWQPDWDKAPDWAKWWAIDGFDRAYWCEDEPKLNIIDDTWDNHYQDKVAGHYGYTGDWRNSLRKRPE